MALDPQAKKIFTEKLQNAARIAAYSVAGIMAVFVIILMGGERFDPILRFLGLGFYAPGGVYADCSKPQNKNNSFCNRSNTNNDRETSSWRDLKNSKGGAAFSLSEK